MNRPLVTPVKWAEISSTDGYAFGAKTSCDSCDFPLQSALRRALISDLITNEALTEREIGFDLSKRYHVEEIMWDGRQRIQLSRFGISEINVKEAITELGTFSISPFVATDIVPAQDMVMGDYYITVPGNVVDNPANVIIRNLPAEGGGAIEQEIQHGYPRRDGTDWLLSIGNKNPSAVNIQHCKYMVLSVNDEDIICTDGEIYAVKPEDGSYIPFVKTVEITGGVMYFFYAWSLIDPAFAEDEKIDLQAGQFWKLCTQIDLECSKSIEALPKVMRNFSTCEDLFPFEEEDGLIITQINDNIIDIRATCCGNFTAYCKAHPIKIVISYRTDPALLKIDLGNLAKGIVYLTAAELPFGVCNCEPPKYGFVATAQKSYGDLKINQATGSETYVMKYGNKYGQLVYAEAIQKTETKQGSKRL